MIQRYRIGTQMHKCSMEANMWMSIKWQTDTKTAKEEEHVNVYKMAVRHRTDRICSEIQKWQTDT
jgi:hypothetical protein